MNQTIEAGRTNIRKHKVPSVLRDPALRKAVREHCEFHGDRGVRLMRIVKNRNSDYEMLLIRVTDENGMKYSSLVFYEQRADGHYEISEMEYARREGEQEMIEEFENSEEYI